MEEYLMIATDVNILRELLHDEDRFFDFYDVVEEDERKEFVKKMVLNDHVKPQI